MIDREDLHHPKRYGEDSFFEAIKVILSWGLGFCMGNLLKYICRAGKKEGESKLKSLSKAKWYLDYKINQLEKRNKQVIRRHESVSEAWGLPLNLRESIKYIYEFAFGLKKYQLENLREAKRHLEKEIGLS